MPEPETPKLYQVLPRELHGAAPLSLLLSNRQPLRFTEYPLAFLVALELKPAMEERYLRPPPAR